MWLRTWPARQRRHSVLRARYYSRAFQRPLKHTWSARRAQSAQPVPAAKGRKALPRSWQSASPILPEPEPDERAEFRGTELRENFGLAAWVPQGVLEASSTPRKTASAVVFVTGRQRSAHQPGR